VNLLLRKNFIFAYRTQRSYGFGLSKNRRDRTEHPSRCWRQYRRPRDGADDRSTGRCTDTSDLRHFGPKTFRHWCRNVQWTLRHHRKNPRHFGTRAEVSARHFGTHADVSWTFRLHLHFVYRSVTLIYLFKKDYFIDD